MKKNILFLLSIIFATVESEAQMSLSKVKFGIQASPTIGWLKTNDNNIKGNGTVTGLKLGAIADYYFQENYAFSTGLGFGFNHGGRLLHDVGGSFLANSTLSDSRLNDVVDRKPLNDGTNIRYHIQYIEIPFSLKMRTQQFGYLRAVVEAPIVTLGYRSQARGDINTDKGDFLKENIKSDVNPVALSWGFGAGVQYDISASTAFVGGIYFQKGFVDVTRDKGAYKAKATAVAGNFEEVKENSKATMGNITLRLGVIF